MLEARGISYKAGSKTLLGETSIQFDAGKLHVIMGPNGAGKSTLLQLLAGELTPASGKVLWNDKALDAYKRVELARMRSVLSQQYAIQFPISVQEVVQLGRYPHAGILPPAEEQELIEACLALMQMTAFRDRDYSTLSGGEAQKVQMSRVLAQLGGPSASGKLLLLDEPVSHLDVRYQHLLLQTAHELATRGNTVVAVLHDINLALRYADRMIFLKEGAVRHELPDTKRLTETLIADVFDLPARLIRDDDGSMVVVF